MDVMPGLEPLDSQALRVGQKVEVAGGGGEVCVAQELLDDAEIGAASE